MLTLPPTPPTHTPLSPSLRPLSTRWHLLKTRATHLQLLLLWTAELLFLTSLLYLTASATHAVVQCFDVLYTMLGRQARSPFAAPSLLPTDGAGIAVSVVLVAAWSLGLARLSYCAVFDGGEEGRGVEKEREEGEGEGEGEGEKEGEDRRGQCLDLAEAGAGADKAVSWGRVLGRLVVPLLLAGFMLRFAYAVAERAADPLPFMTANTDVLEGEDPARLGYAATSA